MLKKGKFIGYASLANTITLFGLAISLTACFLGANGDFKFAVYLMFFACICDMFDGRIARLKRRSEDETFYGIQLDSLCDIVSFGVTPCFLAYSFGFNGVLDVIIYLIFVICGATRLAYFNTLANSKPELAKKVFRGIPIPMSVFVITVLFVLTAFIPFATMHWIFRIVLLLLAIGFILNIRIKKPNLKTGAILIAIEIVLLFILLISGDLKTNDSIGNNDTSTEISQTVSE